VSAIGIGEGPGEVRGHRLLDDDGLAGTNVLPGFDVTANLEEIFKIQQTFTSKCIRLFLASFVGLETLLSSKNIISM
jgi:hypothetical protein